MNPFELLQKQYNELTRSEQKIADLLLKNPSAILSCPNLTDLAKMADSSNAAMVRLCKKIGYSGFSEFKFAMNRQLLSHGVDIASSEEVNEKNPTSIHRILSTYINHLQLISNYVTEEDLQKAAGFICNARYITIWGINRTAQSARQLYQRLGRLGIFSKFTDDTITMTDDANLLRKQDLCILFSVRGCGTPMYEELLHDLNANGCPIILITMNPQMRMCRYASQVITLPWFKNNIPGNFFDDQITMMVLVELLLYHIVKIYKG